MNQDYSPVVIHSDLETTHSQGPLLVDIRIYRSADSGWILELVAGDGNSTVWEDPFESDDAAFGEAILAIKQEGVASFYQDVALMTHH
jgi:uncharacterized protein